MGLHGSGIQKQAGHLIDMSVLRYTAQVLLGLVLIAAIPVIAGIAVKVVVMLFKLGYSLL